MSRERLIQGAHIRARDLPEMVADLGDTFRVLNIDVIRHQVSGDTEAMIASLAAIQNATGDFLTKIANSKEKRRVRNLEVVK